MPRPTSLSFELLKTFVALVENDMNAVKTTSDLKIKQPSMSKRLRYFQHPGPVLARPWLVLEGKTWKLTDEGKQVLPAVNEMILRFQRLRGFLPKSDKDAPEVNFACGQEAASGLVLRALLAFRAKHSEVPVRISTLRGRARIEGVASGSLDLAAVTHDSAAIAKIARRALHIETLESHHLALVCAENSTFAHRMRKWPKTKAPPEAFLGYPLILPAPDAGLRRGVDRVLGKTGVLGKVNLALEIGGWSTILAYVRAGVGVGLVSQGALHHSKSLIVCRFDPKLFPPIESKLICRYVLGTGEEPDLSPAAQTFRAALLQAARA